MLKVFTLEKESKASKEEYCCPAIQPQYPLRGAGQMKKARTFAGWWVSTVPTQQSSRSDQLMGRGIAAQASSPRAITVLQHPPLWPHITNTSQTRISQQETKRHVILFKAKELVVRCLGGQGTLAQVCPWPHQRNPGGSALTELGPAGGARLYPAQYIGIHSTPATDADRQMASTVVLA